MQGIENLSDIAKLDLRYTLVVGLQILAGNGANRSYQVSKMASWVFQFQLQLLRGKRWIEDD